MREIITAFVCWNQTRCAPDCDRPACPLKQWEAAKARCRADIERYESGRPGPERVKYRDSKYFPIMEQIRAIYAENGADLFTPAESWPMNRCFASWDGRVYLLLSKGCLGVRILTPEGEHPVLGTFGIQFDGQSFSSHVFARLQHALQLELVREDKETNWYLIPYERVAL